jgi:hypothetical protein
MIVLGIRQPGIDLSEEQAETPGQIMCSLHILVSPQEDDTPFFH